MRTIFLDSHLHKTIRLDHNGRINQINGLIYKSKIIMVLTIKFIVTLILLEKLFMFANALQL